MNVPRPKRDSSLINPVDFIAKKRDGGQHTAAALGEFINAFVAGRVADYQMSAWLMAAYLRGLEDDEMKGLTVSMLESGQRLKLAGVRSVKVDKHSTGGVGDKVSLPLAPLVAEAGIAVPMISGRGLGHTGGTLDKLESIPGFRVALSPREFERIVARVGCSIMGQTDQLAPADKRMYALRDVTGTVACKPLIVASILSKKLAAGLDGLVLDVKVGRGAFMKDLRSARQLARALVETSTALGTKASALLTQMNRPLGLRIGNALEVHESIAVLRGDGPKDTTELTLELAVEMLLLSGKESNRSQARARLHELLASGRPLERFGRMIEAQGGDPRVIDEPKRLPRSRRIELIRAPRRGHVADIDAYLLGEAGVRLGAGRARAEDRVDPRVGFEILAPLGVEVAKGEPLLAVHLGKTNLSPEVRSALLRSFSLVDERPRRPEPLLLGRVEAVGKVPRSR